MQTYRSAMIAQDTHESARPSAPDALPSLSLPRVAASLQLLLATRRAARNADHATRYVASRGM